MKVTLHLPKKAPSKVLQALDKVDVLKGMQSDSDPDCPVTQDLQPSEEEEDEEDEEEQEQEPQEQEEEEDEEDGNDSDNNDSDDTDNKKSIPEPTAGKQTRGCGPHKKKGMSLCACLHLAHYCLQGRPFHLLSSQRQLRLPAVWLSSLLQK
jgi:hypothetical protein